MSEQNMLDPTPELPDDTPVSDVEFPPQTPRYSPAGTSFWTHAERIHGPARRGRIALLPS